MKLQPNTQSSNEGAKSALFEYRIMHRNDWDWSYYIQYRHTFFLLKLFGWFNVLAFYTPTKMTKTFKTKEEAIDYVKSLICNDKIRAHVKTKKQQVWP